MLDNCEHLVDACARLADALLRACPHLTLLATSREALGLAGETVWPVPALPVPAAGAAGGARPDAAPAPGDLARYAAVRLFCERAAAVRPGFALDAESAPAVAQVCVRLDGLPLALELAAARVRVLSVEQIAARLDDRFRLLTGGSRTAPDRQQTLRATVDWSHALLAAPERVLFHRLAVFAGGFELEAAEAVGVDRPEGPEGLDRGGIEAPGVLDLLTRLVDQSLVVAEAAPGGAARYRLLETLRQYARERPAAGGEREAVGRRHAGYFLGLAERAAGAMHGPAQGAWLDRLERDRDNLQAALGWVLGHGDARRGLRFVEALRWFWEVRGDAAEGRRQAAALLALPALAAAADPGRRARALAVAAQLAHAEGDNAAAVALGTEGAALAVAPGDRRARADALLWLAMARFRLERSASAGLRADGAPGTPGARALLEESLALWRDAGEPWGVAQALEYLGAVTRDAGDPRGARPRYAAALALRRERGDARGVAQTLCSLANLALPAGGVPRRARPRRGEPGHGAGPRRPAAHGGRPAHPEPGGAGAGRRAAGAPAPGGAARGGAAGRRGADGGAGGLPVGGAGGGPRRGRAGRAAVPALPAPVRAARPAPGYDRLPRRPGRRRPRPRPTGAGGAAARAPRRPGGPERRTSWTRRRSCARSSGRRRPPRARSSSRRWPPSAVASPTEPARRPGSRWGACCPWSGRWRRRSPSPSAAPGTAPRARPRRPPAHHRGGRGR